MPGYVFAIMIRPHVQMFLALAFAVSLAASCAGSSDDIALPQPTGDGSAESPFSIAGATFFYDDRGAIWDVQFAGLVEAPKAESNDAAGQCRLLAGTITLKDSGGGLTNDRFGIPRFDMVLGGDHLPGRSNGFGECDGDAARALGYDHITFGYVFEGYSYPFYSEIFVQDGWTLDAIVTGPPDDADTLHFVPDIVDSLPRADAQLFEPDVEVVPFAGAMFVWTIDDPDREATWDVELGAVVELPVGEGGQDGDRCFALLGTLTPSDAAADITTHPFGGPPFGALVDGLYDGVYFSSVIPCEADALEEAGYASLRGFQIPPDEPRVFFELLRFRDDADPEIVVAGEPHSNQALFFTFDPTDVIPPA